MAKKRNKIQVNKGFKDFSLDLKDGNIYGAIYFIGSEELLIDWAISSVVSRYINEAVLEIDMVKIDLDNATFDFVVSVCEMPAMLSEKKVVVIKNYGGEFGDNFISYLETISEDVVVIITTNSLNDKLVNAVSDDKAYQMETIDRPELKNFIKKRLKGFNKKIDNVNISLLIDESHYYDKDSDYKLYNFENDLMKIAYLSEDVLVDENSIKDGLSYTLEKSIFAIFDSLNASNKKKALDTYKDLILAGEDNFKILGSLVYQLELMYQIKELSNAGYNLNDINERLKNYNFVQIKIANKNVRNMEINHIAELLYYAFDIDALVKSGKIDADVAIELLIMQY